MKYNEEDNNGIVKVKQNGFEYTVWTHANIARPYIKNYLGKRLPGKLVIRELNQVDLSIPEENLPIEIQSTLLGKGYIVYSQWEDKIKRQIDQNITNYGRCWFFFDSELLRGMQNSGKQTSINMDWFRKFMKEEKLKVFTVSHDGIIEEKQYKDFDFLSEISQTCKIASETDSMILNRNKMKIFANVIKGYGFTQDEIDRFENGFEESVKFSGSNIKSFLIGQKDERSNMYGYILKSISNLSDINQLLCKNIRINENRSMIRHTRYTANFLGIFYVEGLSNNVTIRFIDRFNICKYFPGYLRTKDIWNKLKGHNLNGRQFDNIVTGKNDVVHGLEYYFQEDDKIDSMEENIDREITQNQTDNDKEVNIKIDNKDDTININIKSKQKTIEDAWS